MDHTSSAKVNATPSPSLFWSSRQCSQKQCLRVLPLCPTYTLEHSEQGIWHTTRALVHGYKVWGYCVDRKPLWCRRVQGSMDASNHLSLVWVHCYYVNACRWTSVGSHSPSIYAQFSSFWLHVPHHSMVVHWLGSSKVLTTKAFCVTRWCKSTVRYWLVCVSFWYTNVVINLSDSAQK